MTATRTCEHGHEYVVQTSADVGNCPVCKLSEYQLSLGKARQHLELERETSNRIAAELDATKSRLDTLSARNAVLEQSHDPYRNLLDIETRDARIKELEGLLDQATKFAEGTAESFIKRDCAIEDLTAEHELTKFKLHQAAVRLNDALLRLNEYRKLCPSVQDLETGEQLHPESTVTVGLGYLRKLIEDRDFLNEHSPYQTCARCGEEFRTLEMTWEEGDEMECLPCNERENARERAEIQAGGVETHAHNLGEQK